MPSSIASGKTDARQGKSLSESLVAQLIKMILYYAGVLDRIYNLDRILRLNLKEEIHPMSDDRLCRQCVAHPYSQRTSSWSTRTSSFSTSFLKTSFILLH